MIKSMLTAGALVAGLAFASSALAGGPGHNAPSSSLLNVVAKVGAVDCRCGGGSLVDVKANVLNSGGHNSGSLVDANVKVGDAGRGGSLLNVGADVLKTGGRGGSLLDADVKVGDAGRGGSLLSVGANVGSTGRNSSLLGLGVRLGGVGF